MGGLLEGDVDDSVVPGPWPWPRPGVVRVGVVDVLGVRFVMRGEPFMLWVPERLTSVEGAKLEPRSGPTLDSCRGGEGVGG